jgi:hypothetical protein
MQIDKNQIIEFLRNQGDSQKADQAEQELPGRSTPTRRSIRTCCSGSASTRSS